MNRINMKRIIELAKPDEWTYESKRRQWQKKSESDSIQLYVSNLFQLPSCCGIGDLDLYGFMDVIDHRWSKETYENCLAFYLYKKLTTDVRDERVIICGLPIDWINCYDGDDGDEEVITNEEYCKEYARIANFLETVGFERYGTPYVNAGSDNILLVLIGQLPRNEQN